MTPPEFRGLEPRDHPAARVGGARVELYRDGDRTRLGRCYQQIPVRLLPPFEIEGESACLLYLVNITAGLLDGDGHLIELSVRPGSRAVVTGQSACRVHPALRSFATQQWDVEVGDDATLVVLPGPTIPYRGCRFYQRGRVALAPRARLIWGDIWLPGRYERGADSERFVFDRIVQDVEVRRSGRPIYRDRFRWDGPWSEEDVDWYLGGELATAGLFAAGPLPERPAPEWPGLRQATFPLDTGGFCMRWCGHPATVAAALVRTAMQLAAEWTDGPGSPPWLIASSGLAPNHWFSTPPGG